MCFVLLLNSESRDDIKEEKKKEKEKENSFGHCGPTEFCACWVGVWSCVAKLGKKNQPSRVNNTHGIQTPTMLPYHAPHSRRKW